MGASNISKCMKHHGFDRPCFKLSATNSNRYAMFYANNSNDNQAWYSGVNNRRVQCSYEDQCKQIKAAPSQTVLKFLSQWRFAGDPIKLVMTGENLDVLAAGIIQRCLSDPSNPSNPIAELYLARCSLNEMKMNDICVGLFKNKTVTKLDLSKTLMKPGMAAALAKALEHNYKNGGALQELVLDDSKFEEKGFESLVSGLSKSGLAKLSLQRCALRDDSASALAKGLGTHGEMGFIRLVDINLSGNFIGDKGAEAIGEGLAQNQVLLSLNLNKNKIGDEGGVAVAEAVRKNTSLQDLYLQGNELGSNASVALTRTAQMSSCLRNLSFGDNKLDRQHMSVMHLLYKYGFAPEKKE
uniref:PH domain-containing protein n=1 Tax=Amorphochlora amoebiformis TaxID=1561963 RepID=A0A7S0GU38_9EUKA